MFASLIGKPSGLLGCSNDHLKMLPLSGISDINDSICLDLVESVMYSSEVRTVVVVATIRFDCDERNRVFFNENAFGFSSFIAG